MNYSRGTHTKQEKDLTGEGAVQLEKDVEKNIRASVLISIGTGQKGLLITE